MFQATYWTTSTATTSDVGPAVASGALGAFDPLSAATTSASGSASAGPGAARDYVVSGSTSDQLSAPSAAAAPPPEQLRYTELRSGTGGAGAGASPTGGVATTAQHTRHSSTYTRISSSSSTPPLSLASPQMQQQTASGAAGAGGQSGAAAQLSTGVSAVHSMQPAFSSFSSAEWKTPASVKMEDTGAAAPQVHYSQLPYEVMYVPSAAAGGQQGGQISLAASAGPVAALGQATWLQSAASGLQYAQSADPHSAFAVGLGAAGATEALAQWPGMPVAVAKAPFALPHDQFSAIGRVGPLAPHEVAAVAEQMCTCRPLLPYNPFSAGRLVSPQTSYPPALETAASATAFGSSSSTSLSLLEQHANAFGSAFAMGIEHGIGVAGGTPNASSGSLRRGNDASAQLTGCSENVMAAAAAAAAAAAPAAAASAHLCASMAGGGASAASLARSARSSSEERRVRNNEASKRSRRNQKAKQEQLQRTLQHLEADNLTLQNRLSRAQGLVRNLREQVVQHMYTTQQ